MWEIGCYVVGVEDGRLVGVEGGLVGVGGGLLVDVRGRRLVAGVGGGVEGGLVDVEDGRGGGGA